MYDIPDFYLVANPINRYSIGDRTPGLRIAEAGSLTIFLQSEPRRSPGWGQLAADAGWAFPADPAHV